MKTINTCEEVRYNPLGSGCCCHSNSQTWRKHQIIMNDSSAFSDIKAYLSEQKIGFREIYDGEKMSASSLNLKPSEA